MPAQRLCCLVNNALEQKATRRRSASKGAKARILAPLSSLCARQRPPRRGTSNNGLSLTGTVTAQADVGFRPAAPEMYRVVGWISVNRRQTDQANPILRGLPLVLGRARGREGTGGDQAQRDLG